MGRSIRWFHVAERDERMIVEKGTELEHEQCRLEIALPIFVFIGQKKIECASEIELGRTELECTASGKERSCESFDCSILLRRKAAKPSDRCRIPAQSDQTEC